MGCASKFLFTLHFPPPPRPYLAASTNSSAPWPSPPNLTPLFSSLHLNSPPQLRSRVLPPLKHFLTAPTGGSDAGNNNNNSGGGWNNPFDSSSWWLLTMIIVLTFLLSFLLSLLFSVVQL
ncbi:hypothetical protein ACLB2K_018600 [Fragaria x ananassa]